jgi:PAS domain S-box-containing protein
MTAPSSAPPPVDPTIRRLLAFFAVISAVLVAVVVIAIRNINRAELGSDWVNHTHAVILEVDAVLASVHAAESAVRTFVMTGDARDLAAGRAAISEMSEHVEIAKALTQGEAAQNVQVVAIEKLVTQRAEFAQRILTAAASDRAAAANLLATADASVATIGEIRRAVERLKGEEMALLAQRDTAAYLQAQTTRWTVWTGVALDVLLLGAAAWLIRDDIAARRRAATVLAEANAVLEIKVKERTAELSASNEKLLAENLEQRWAHQAAEHQLRYYQIVFNSLNDLVFVVTKAMNVSRVNPAVVSVTGSEPSALIDRPLANFVRLAGDPGAKLEPMLRALREGRELRAQSASINDGNGQPVAVRLTLFPVRDRDKVVGGVVVLELLHLDTPLAS